MWVKTATIWLQLDGTFLRLLLSLKAFILEFPKIIYTELLEMNSWSQLQKFVKGEACFLYSNSNFIVWVMKLDFTDVASGAPLTSVCEDISISGLEWFAKLWNRSPLLLQVMSKSTKVGICWEVKLYWSCCSVKYMMSLFSNRSVIVQYSVITIQ